MIVPHKVEQKFRDIETSIKYVSDHVKPTVYGYCERNGFAFICRKKSIQSLAEKIETGRIEKWSDIDDIFACTVIIPNLSYEEDVLEFLESTYSKIKIRKRGSTLKSPDVFRFDSTRFIGKLTPIEENMQSPIYDIKFEVQIHTAFEHAWAMTTHSMTYKGELIDWRRYRLTAQLKAAVEQMDMLVMGFDQVSKNISEYVWPDIEAKKKIIDKFKAAFDDGLIRDELEPKDWTRFSNNIYNIITATSEAQNMKSSKKAQHIDKSLTAFFNEIETLGRQKIPLSISLTQWIFGILSECEFLKPPLVGDYHPLITDELLKFYPSVDKFENTFTFDE